MSTGLRQGITGLWLGVETTLSSDFSSMDLDEFGTNYTLATRAINELVHEMGGWDMLKNRVDDRAQKYRESVEKLVAYKEEMTKYFNSLKK